MVKSGGVSGHSHAEEQEQAGARKRGKKRRLSPRLHITLPPEVYQKAKERWPNVSRVVASLLEVALSEDLTVEEVVTAVTLLRRGVLVAGERRGSLAWEGAGLEIPWAYARQGSNPCPGAKQTLPAQSLTKVGISQNCRARWGFTPLLSSKNSQNKQKGRSSRRYVGPVLLDYNGMLELSYHTTPNLAQYRVAVYRPNPVQLCQGYL